MIVNDVFVLHQLLYHFDGRPHSEVTRRIDQRVDHRGMVMARRGAKAGAARPESGATPPWLTEKDRNSERTRGNNRQTGSARTGVRTAATWSIGGNAKLMDIYTYMYVWIDRFDATYNVLYKCCLHG